MDVDVQLLIEFALIFLFLLVFAYLIPAGALQWIVAERAGSEISERRIQERRARRADVRREVRHSLQALFFFSVFSLGLLKAYEAGYTAVYTPLDAYPLWWLPLSLVVATVLHDTYFYWTHRLMHTRWFYRTFHAGHHRSITPTPWAILAFQPAETIPQFGFFALLIVLVPMHPAALLAYLMFDGFINAAGHCGHELVPDAVRRNRALSWLNHVGHHDLHHTKFRFNYGQYFSVWDRVMGTYRDPAPLAGERSSSADI